MIRAYLIFFGEGDARAWWDVFTRTGFRHVCAAGFDPESDRWVFVDPHRRGMDVLVLPEEDATSRLGVWATAASAVLRVEVGRERAAMPAVFGCVGAIKALIGHRSRALSPFGLHRHLLRHGAERIEVPSGNVARGR